MFCCVSGFHPVFTLGHVRPENAVDVKFAGAADAVDVADSADVVVVVDAVAIYSIYDRQLYNITYLNKSNSLNIQYI